MQYTMWKWKNLLIIFFHLHLEFGMKHLHSTGCLKHALNDSRIYQLAQDLGKRNEVASDSLTAKDVNDQSIYFPPCMAHLYQTLKTRHRLSHEARRQFTLFLKDIGMTVDEALTFWSTVYSLPSSSCDTGCTHSWQKDARRYRYSIRHMYGLEGGRYSYRVSSCNKIQKTNLSSQAEGGCPFHHFDDNRMLSIFSSTLLTDKFTLNQIMHLKGIGKPQEACHTYLTAQQMLYSKERTTDISHEVDISKKLNSDKTIKFNDAVQFYLHLTST